MVTQVKACRGQDSIEETYSHDFFNLLDIAGDALKISPPLYVSSILGLPWTWIPPHHYHSEFRIIDPWRLGRTIQFLVNVNFPSIPRKPLSFGPPILNYFFWRPSVVLQRPDHLDSYTSFPQEAWFFINGIMTNDAVAQINAAYLADLFHRPITLIQNSTGAFFEDLLECAFGKGWYRTTDAVRKAFPPIYDALKSEKKRVVVIAHSQGTIIAAVILRLLSAITRLPEEAAGPPSLMMRAAPFAEREYVYQQDIPINLDDFDQLEEKELEKLEVYCFANCATTMSYHKPAQDRGKLIPWIESFGNEYDIVARLGMLASKAEQRKIKIDGPRYVLSGTWGHLLNEHYLVKIEKHQRVGHRKHPKGGSAPYSLVDGDPETEAQTPRLFYYINGGSPE